MSLKRYLTGVRDMDVNDALRIVGLQKRSKADWVFPMLMGFGAGLAVGAGLAFFLTPYRGDEARNKVAKGASDAQRALTEHVNQLSEKVSALMHKSPESKEDPDIHEKSSQEDESGATRGY